MIPSRCSPSIETLIETLVDFTPPSSGGPSCCTAKPACPRETASTVLGMATVPVLAVDYFLPRSAVQLTSAFFTSSAGFSSNLFRAASSANKYVLPA